jgi:hypothetical protein
MKVPHSVDPREVIRGSRVFRSYERRDAMYKVATFLVGHFWGKPRDMADGLGVLLLTWNNALYRYGSFDLSALEKVLGKKMDVLSAYRDRDIGSFSKVDEQTIKDLFSAFLRALTVADGKAKGRKSPVAVAKALHLLAPGFFPLWDDKIAGVYNCHYSRDPVGNYLAFMWMMKEIAKNLKSEIRNADGVTLLKVLDEYNYAKYTKEWI